jgi:hypothetical protein
MKKNFLPVKFRKDCVDKTQMIFELRNLLEDHKLISKMVEGKIQH